MDTIGPEIKVNGERVSCKIADLTIHMGWSGIPNKQNSRITNAVAGMGIDPADVSGWFFQVWSTRLKPHEEMKANVIQRLKKINLDQNGLVINAGNLKGLQSNEMFALVRRYELPEIYERLVIQGRSLATGATVCDPMDEVRLHDLDLDFIYPGPQELEILAAFVLDHSTPELWFEKYLLPRLRVDIKRQPAGQIIKQHKPGGFFKALLECDYTDAITRADMQNYGRLATGGKRYDQYHHFAYKLSSFVRTFITEENFINEDNRK